MERLMGCSYHRFLGLSPGDLLMLGKNRWVRK